MTGMHFVKICTQKSINLNIYIYLLCSEECDEWALWLIIYIACYMYLYSVPFMQQISKIIKYS